MPELTTISITGFKSIADVKDLDLRPINVLIGPNGSGKSNFLGVFSLLRAFREGRLDEYVVIAGGANKVLHFGSKQTTDIYVGLTFGSGFNRYVILLIGAENDRLIPQVETFQSVAKSNLHEIKHDPADIMREYRDKIVAYDTTGKEIASTHPVFDPSDKTLTGDRDTVSMDDHMGENVEGWKMYHFHDTGSSSPMKKTADVNDNRFLRPDGSNLAAFLYLLRVKHEASYNLIRRSVQLVAPFFDDFQLEPLNLNPNTIKLEWRHKNTDSYFDASSFSDGTLRFIALATLFLQPEELRPSVILVDEPELGLHPYAITILASLIKQASVKTQVIVSTQSPQLLDNFEPEDVIVADLVDGATQLRRLDSKELASWLEEYSLGELWEKNQFGGRPGALS